jgi:hypothetical protein
MSEQKSPETTSAQNDLKIINNTSNSASRLYRSNNCHINLLSRQKGIPHSSNVWPTNTPMLNPVKPKSKEDVWPPNRQMLEIIEQVIRSNSTCLEKPEFCFEMTLEVAKKNFLTLKRHNLNLGAAIQAQSKFPVGYSILETISPSYAPQKSPPLGINEGYP